jgi:hypothetical protein
LNGYCAFYFWVTACFCFASVHGLVIYEIYTRDAVHSRDGWKRKISDKIMRLEDFRYIRKV